MPCFETKDRTSLFYRDWGQGKTVVFCAGWSLSSDMWRSEMLALSEAGMRCVAYDRRGHGRSDDPGGGYDYDTLSDDLASLLIELDLNDVCLVGHSMAGGELIRYLSRHGTSRVERIVLLSSVLPVTIVGADNPGGLDPSLFETLRSAWRTDFGQWLEDSADAYFGRDLSGSPVSQESIDWTIRDMQTRIVPGGLRLQPFHGRSRLAPRDAESDRSDAAHPWRCRCLAPHRLVVPPNRGVSA